MLAGDSEIQVSGGTSLSGGGGGSTSPVDPMFGLWQLLRGGLRRTNAGLILEGDAHTRSIRRGNLR